MPNQKQCKQLWDSEIVKLHCEPDCVSSNATAVATHSHIRTSNTLCTASVSNNIDCNSYYRRPACGYCADCRHCWWHLWWAIVASWQPYSAYRRCRSDSNRDDVDDDQHRYIHAVACPHDFPQENWNNALTLDPSAGNMAAPRIFVALSNDDVADGRSGHIYWTTYRHRHCPRYFCGGRDVFGWLSQRNRSTAMNLAVNVRCDFYYRVPDDYDSRTDDDPNCPDAPPFYSISMNSFRWAHLYGRHCWPQHSAMKWTNIAWHLALGHVRVLSPLHCTPMWSHRRNMSIHLRYWAIDQSL